jgi:hypothetical protein
MPAPVVNTAAPLPDFTFRGRPFRPRGVNLGSWLVLEDFMLGLDGTDWQIRRAFADHLGDSTAAAFLRAYRRHFITPADLRRIAELGFNCVRVPFAWRYLESASAPGIWNTDTLALLDGLFDDCATQGLAVLLDLHAAPGGQNTTPPADQPTGYAELWNERPHQDRVCALWRELARRYHAHPALLGYNLLNEPQTHLPGELTPAAQTAAMNGLYHRLVAEIRAVDPAGWIVIEGPVRQGGGNALLDPALFADPRTASTFHHYPLYEDSLRLDPAGPRLPEGDDVEAHRAFLRAQTAPELEFARRSARPCLLGEYGLSARWEPRRAHAIFQAQTDVAEEMGFGWLLWTYKDIWRLGLYVPRPDTPWLRFVRDPALLGLRDELGAALRAHFDSISSRLAHRPAPTSRWLREAAFEEMQRGQNRLMLEHQLSLLAAQPPAEILAMAESFALENCVLREETYAALRPYLRTGTP